MSELRRVTIRVEGLVQGVNFRQAARQTALRLGISGFARNEDDGSVTVEAEGDPASIDALIDWCSRGPDHARVEAMSVTDGPVAGYRGFARI